MYPILFKIENVFELSTGWLVLEAVIGIAAFLAWLALYLRGRQDWVASSLNTVAILVALHFALSKFMGAGTPITIYSFGVLIILGFLAGSWYMLRQTDQLRLDRKKIFDWGFWMLIIGIIGARVMYAYLNYDDFTGEGNKLNVFKIWEGGLVWYGGLVPAMLIGLYLLRKNKLPMLHVADIGAIAVILALAIGRWACLLAGDDYGRPTDAWYGIRFYNEDALVNKIHNASLLGVPLHPTQLYMSVNCLWLVFILEWIRRRARFAGQAFAWMLILYAVTRAVLIEPFRGDFVERNPGYKHHVAATIHIEKGADSPAVSLERGTAVRDADGRTGKLLEDLELEAGEALGSVRAISDEPVEKVHRGLLSGLPEWEVDQVDGLPAGVQVTPGASRRYDSDLPVPPGYVSTSQWIGIFIVLAGVAILLMARKANVPGFSEAVEAAQAEPEAEPTG